MASKPPPPPEPAPQVRILLPAVTVARAVLVVAGVIAGLYLLYQARSVIGLLFAAVFFALAIAPPVNWLQGRGLPRPLAILLVYLGIVAAIFGVGLLLVPPVVDGVNDLSNDLPGYLQDLRENDTFADYDDRYNITENLEEQANELPARLGDAAGTLADVTVGVFSRFVQLFSILVITFFLLMEGNRILAFAYREMGPQRGARAQSLAREISKAVSGYVFGAFVIATLNGVVSYVTLTILDIPFSVPLAILMAFFGLIPLVGATIGGILVGIVIAFVSFPGGLIVWAIVLVVYQQVENNLVQPLVYGRAVQVHPLGILIAVLIGAALLGILGALVAIPAAAAVQSFLREWWRLRRGDEPEPIAAATVG